MGKPIETCSSWYKKNFKMKYKSEKVGIKKFFAESGCDTFHGVSCGMNCEVFVKLHKKLNS